MSHGRHEGRPSYRRGTLRGREEGRVDQVVDVFRVTRGARNEAPERLLVSIVEFAEGTDLAAGELMQDVGVGLRGTSCWTRD